MLSMEKGRERRWGCCGLCCCCWAAMAAAAAGRKGWKSSGGAGRAEVMVAPPVGECGDPEEAGEEGSGVSVTLISGLGGQEDIMAEETSAAAEEEASFSELGGLAGSTISTGRLSRLIMLNSSYLSRRQRCLSVSVCWEIFYN